jgi:hypothetical protein
LIIVNGIIHDLVGLWGDAVSEGLWKLWQTGGIEPNLSVLELLKLKK